MKVKSMKKALSLLCAGAMIATSFAVVNFDTVEAAAKTEWNDGTTIGAENYVKVPTYELTCEADNQEVSGEGTNGRANQLVDGDISTYYHSKYSGGNPVNLGSNSNNKIRLKFSARRVSGVSYLPRQNSVKSNGTIESLEVQVKTSSNTEWTTVTLKNNSGSFTYDSSWPNAGKKEHVVLFDTAQDNVTDIQIVVKGAHGNSFISGAELSVLTPATYNETGVYNISDLSDDAGKRFAAPAPSGKIFEGWYSDDARTKHLAEGVATGNAYAKFIDANVLTVKSQVPVATDSLSETTTLRFLTTLASNQYKEAGFYVTINGNTIKKPTNAVFNSLTVVGENGVDKNLKPNSFSATDSKYFIAVNLTKMGKNLHKNQYSAQPYFVTFDGIEVKGNKVSRSVNDNLGEFYKGTLKQGTDGYYWADDTNSNWRSVAKLKKEGALTVSSGSWQVYPGGDGTNHAEFIFGQKLEIVDARNAGLKYEFDADSKGIVIYAHIVENAGSMKIKIDGQVLTPEGLNCQGTNTFKAYLFSKKDLTALANGAKHTLEIYDVNGKVCLDSFYIVK